MGIQKDAGEVLVYIYKKYTSNEPNYMVNSGDLLKETKWDISRLRKSITYLTDRGLIKAVFFLGGEILVEKLYPEGINIVENKNKFKTTFGFEVNLGLVKFSWIKEKKH